MRLRNELFIKIVIFILLLVFVYVGGYVYSFLRYNDKEIVKMEVLEIENNYLKNNLKNLVNFSSLDEDNYVIGKVIIRDIYSFYDEVIINLGSNDVNEGDAVINEEGLIGIIYKVDENMSYVKLLSGEYNVSVKIGDTYGNLNKGTVTLLDKYIDFKEGDLVYTSGLSNIQEGIYVGKINSITMDKDNLGKELKLELVDNNNLNYVAVLRGLK